jgi:H+-translocating diphosphatase
MLLNQKGAYRFLFLEYIYLGIFILIFFVILFLIDMFKFYTAMAFLLGALTSLVSGFIGMMIATASNVRVTYLAALNKDNKPESMRTAFNVAFRGGCVMGFFLVSLALLILTLMIIVYLAIMKPTTILQFEELFDFIAGYGLGGSTVALFCRVGGGIYTKAADVGADLVGKCELGLKEDSPDNPATIADNVGDNVGDIAGMGSDLFGSFSESTCAALVVSATSPELIVGSNYMTPLVVSGLGIVACLIVSFIAIYLMPVTSEDRIENTLKWQLILSSLLLSVIISICYYFFLPWNITFQTSNSNLKATVYHNWGIGICSLLGLWSGLVIGLITDYFTSKAHGPTIDLAHSCKSGTAINIINGLALGYFSVVIPIIMIGITIFFSFTLGGMYGISIAALGMLSNLSLALAIDGYGPISDNAGGIAEMSELPEEVRHVTDALDAAGNTTAAVGKGFAIGSACLVAIALFGAFVVRTNISSVNMLEDIQIAAILIGAMIPYIFSALTMKSVGEAASEMVK